MFWIHKTFTIELNNSYKIVYNLLDDYYKFVGRRDSMITVYKHIEEELVSDCTVSDATKGSWVNLVNPDPDELSLINILTEIPTDVLKTALDMEERSHVELEDNYIFVVINIPVVDVYKRQVSPWFQRLSCIRSLALTPSSSSIMLGAVSRVRLQISMRIVPLSILSRIVRFYCVTIRTKRRTYLCGK